MIPLIVLFFCYAKLIISRLDLHDHFPVLFPHDLNESGGGKGFIPCLYHIDASRLQVQRGRCICRHLKVIDAPVVGELPFTFYTSIG